MIEELERLQKENNDLEFANNVLEKRLRHLLKSKTIRDFDTKNYFNGKYKYDISDLDKCIFKLEEYYSKDFELILLTNYSLKKLTNGIKRGCILIDDSKMEDE